ncbi:MAG: hypothetical protein LRS46_02835 [Desulfurococcales archaeon]|nr:hypothetical protein [Desulfurococcales archaeon]
MVFAIDGVAGQNIHVLLEAVNTTTTAANATGAAVAGGNATASLASLFATMASNPYVAASILVQFFLGLALGYVSVKALKYVLSFIGILVLGAFLNVWSLGKGSVQDALQQYYQEIKQAAPLIEKLAATLGLLTVGPVSIGYIIGLIIGFTRK